MKPFWGDLFFDVIDCNFDKTAAAIMYGNMIRGDLLRVEDAIRDLDGKKALKLIAEMKETY
jgi:hypothetical protein